MNDTPPPPLPPPSPPSGGGLAWPPHPHDPGPAPTPPVTRDTRKRLDLWDRVKFLVLLGVVFGIFVWNELTDNPLLPVRDAFRTAVQDKTWVFVLLAVEVLRQCSYLLAERSAGYHRFWSRTIFGRWNDRVERIDPWARFRIGRALKWVAALGILGAVVGATTGDSFVVALFRLPATIYGVLPTLLQFALIMLVSVGQFVAIFWFLSRGGVEVYFPDDIETRFDSVWGQDAVVERVKENMVFLENPESIEEKGGYVPGGLLLWGPPGTGKTLIAEAVAGETGKPFVFVEPGAFINMFFGVGVLKVKGLFRKLRKLALRYGGVIVFFDEADSLGNRGQLSTGGFMRVASTSAEPCCNGVGYLSEHSRALLLEHQLRRQPGAGDAIVTTGMGGGGMGTLQALLTELSGLKKPRGLMNRYARRALGMRPKPPPKYRIFVMMATNMPNALDEALLRPGRIDRIYKVGYPTKEGRRRTYEGYLAKVSHQLTPTQVDKLATITPYATGATIKDMINEALVVAIRDGREVITWPDILRAKQLKDLGLPDDTAGLDRERYGTAIHEACHGVAGYLRKSHWEIDLASIERRGDTGGMVAFVKPEDQQFTWRSEYEADLITTLASLAGERLFFEGDNANGVAGDLGNATRLAIMMEGFYGMGASVASHGVQRDFGVGGGGPKPGGEEKETNLLAGPLGDRVEQNLVGLLEQARVLLDEHRHLVFALAHALLQHKTISGEDVMAVLEGNPGPVVNGAWYHSEEFAGLAERYHQAALEAHRVKRAIAMDPIVAPPVERVLPSLVGAVPVAPWPDGPTPSATPPPPGVPTFLPPPPPPGSPGTNISTEGNDDPPS